jgi:RNA polymerase sigma-70 factor (ECF subfamily)
LNLRFLLAGLVEILLEGVLEIVAEVLGGLAEWLFTPSGANKSNRKPHMNTSEQIWLNYHTGLLNFICHRVGNRDLAEDLLQDVFVKIHTRLDSLSDSERLQGWLYRIAQNSIIDHYRSGKSLEPLPETLAETLAREPAEDDQVWSDLATCLRPMIEDLPEMYRDALLLSELEGMPLKEVAGRLGISLPGAKSRVQRGRAKLKEMMVECCQFEFDGRGKPISYSPSCRRVNC